MLPASDVEKEVAKGQIILLVGTQHIIIRDLQWEKVHDGMGAMDLMPLLGSCVTTKTTRQVGLNRTGIPKYRLLPYLGASSSRCSSTTKNSFLMPPTYVEAYES